MDRTYTGHIHTLLEPQRFKFTAGSYRGNVLIVHLWSTFPVHILPEPRAIVDQKEDREKRSAGADASAAAEDAGAHTGARAEGSSHSASTGEGTLLK